MHPNKANSPARLPCGFTVWPAWVPWLDRLRWLNEPAARQVIERRLVIRMALRN